VSQVQRALLKVGTRHSDSLMRSDETTRDVGPLGPPSRVLMAYQGAALGKNLALPFFLPQLLQLPPPRPLPNMDSGGVLR